MRQGLCVLIAILFSELHSVENQEIPSVKGNCRHLKRFPVLVVSKKDGTVVGDQGARRSWLVKDHPAMREDELDLDRRDPVLEGRFGKDQGHTEPILYDKILSSSMCGRTGPLRAAPGQVTRPSHRPAFCQLGPSAADPVIVPHPGPRMRVTSTYRKPTKNLKCVDLRPRPPDFVFEIAFAQSSILVRRRSTVQSRPWAPIALMP